MRKKNLWKAGLVAAVCLAAGALCGFALPAPEGWLDLDPDFFLTRPFAGDAQEEGDITILPLPEETPEEGDVFPTVPAEPEPVPEGPLTAVFLS